jgi:hypothetical protein
MLTQVLLTKLRPGALAPVDLPANVAVSTVSRNPLARFLCVSVFVCVGVGDVGGRAVRMPTHESCVG